MAAERFVLKEEKAYWSAPTGKWQSEKGFLYNFKCNLKLNLKYSNIDIQYTVYTLKRINVIIDKSKNKYRHVFFSNNLSAKLNRPAFCHMMKYNPIKGTVRVISSDSRCKDDNVQKRVPLIALSNYE